MVHERGEAQLRSEHARDPVIYPCCFSGVFFSELGASLRSSVLSLYSTRALSAIRQVLERHARTEDMLETLLHTDYPCCFSGVLFSEALPESVGRLLYK